MLCDVKATENPKKKKRQVNKEAFRQKKMKKKNRFIILQKTVDKKNQQPVGGLV